MEELWARIMKMLSILAPEIWLSIQPGASAFAIQQVEEKMGLQLPEEVKIFYRLQNGTADRWFEGAEDLSEEMREAYHLPKNPHNIEGFIDAYRISSLDQICGGWESAKEEYEPCGGGVVYNTYFPHQDTGFFSPYEWHPKWFFFMGNGFASSYCVDLAPGPKGQMGQILQVNGPSGEDQKQVVAPSLQTFLATIADNLEAGKYHFDETTGVLWSQEMLSTVSADMLEYLRELRQRWKNMPMSPHISHDDYRY